MPQAVLVIHGAGEPRLRQGKVHWEPLLAAGLGATPCWSGDWPEFALAPQELKRLRSLSPVSFFHGRDDTEVSLEHVDRYAQAMPQAAIHRLDSRGHEFDQETLPELVAAIRAVT